MTLLHLKGLAIVNRQPIYRVIDTLVSQAWQEISDRPIPKGTEHHLSKVSRQFFKKIFH